MTQSKYFALVVGNSHYTNTEDFPTIEYAARDAHKVFEILTSLESSLFDPKLSKKGTNLDKVAFNEILGEFFRPISKGDVVLIYFAGHAEKIAGKKRLLLAMKSTNKNQLAHTAFNIDGFLPYLEEKKINRYIVILDCCLAGTALDSPGVKHRGEIRDTDLQNLSGSGKVFVAASLHFQLANELESLKHGLFSNYFVQGIESGDAVERSKPYISITDIYSYIRRMMLTHHQNLDQEPIMDGTDIVGELLVARNIKHVPESIHFSELQEFMKRSLDIEDLSDKDKLHRARLRKLHSFLSVLDDTELSFESLSRVALIYAEAVGLSKHNATAELDEFIAAKRFESISIPHVTLPKLNAQGNAYLFSAAYGYYAYESTELQSSVFSYYFREGLTGLASDVEGFVTLSSAFKYLNFYVRDYGEFNQIPSLFMDRMKGDPVLTSAGVNWEQFKGKRHALIIGVSEYKEHHFSNLHFAQQDAESLAVLLAEKGGFDCITLINPTYHETLEKLTRKLEQLNPDELFFFYFTGHGFSIENEGFAALSDSKLERFDIINSLKLSYLSKILNQYRAGSSIVVLDACLSPSNLEAVVR